MPVSDTLTAARLALWCIPGVGTTLFRTLTRDDDGRALYFDKRYLAHNPLNLSAAVLDKLKHPPWTLVENIMRWAQQPRHYIIDTQDTRYPPLLTATTDHPPLLFVAGNLQLCQQPALAMVGSRKPSAMGLDNAFSFAHTLAQTGLTIVSGLALGIDAASHQGALSATGHTIAVLANGIDITYPRQHHALQRQMIEQAAVITEFPHTNRPSTWHFPRRNRLISGLSLGTLIVEAARQSGSLITAQHALEQGREVFAIPGSIHNPMAKGCHNLIQQGAKLIETAQDILEEIQPQLAVRHCRIDKKPVDTLAKPLKKILNAVDYEITTLDLIVRRSGFNAAQASAMLTELELNGLLDSTAEGYLRKG
jgi:DNA processing protein